MVGFLGLINTVINLYIYIVIIRVVLSWIPHNREQALIRIIYQITDPALDKIRRWLPDMAGLDFSPMVLILGLYILKRILYNFFF
jgi:YggT family protein